MDDSKERDLEDAGRYLEGDQAAGETLFGRYMERLYRFVSGFVGDADLAMDLGNDVARRLLENDRSKLRRWHESPRAPFWNYIRRIAVNACYDHCKKASYRRERPFPEDLEPTDARVRDILEVLAADDELQRLMEYLSERDVKLMTLLLQDIPRKQIAKMMHRSENNVNVLIHRLFKKLRARADQLRFREHDG